MLILRLQLFIFINTVLQIQSVRNVYFFRGKTVQDRQWRHGVKCARSLPVLLAPPHACRPQQVNDTHLQFICNAAL